MYIKKMIDLSQDIYHNCPVLPQFSPPKIEYLLIGPRDGWNLEQITLNLHTATHMDAPAHLADFRQTLDQIPVDRFQGRLVLVPLTSKPAGAPIEIEDLKAYEECFHEDSIVFLHTGWGEKRSWTKEFIYESPFLSNEAAQYLVDKNIRGVGIDHFSIGGTGEQNEETHRILLQAGIWIAEGLTLCDPELYSGPWHIMALPVKIRESSGAPARIVAFQAAADNG
ncbi:cyclase family protein [Paenibacillus turpanensis]|uniref:cyclase family protein n=1 Tax=Paenibacillus turpanensis TaxID=2689078 RepID=UPI00140AD7B7|nr:cyclase family protein [Paenibacillus turpanensis]